MTKLKVWLVVLFLCTGAYGIYGQQTHAEELWEQLSEDDEENSYNLSELIEEFYELTQSPLNLNAITKGQLEQFPFLTDTQIENLLAYIYVYGNMQTIYELSLVPEMDRQTIALLLPFVYVKPIPKKETLPSFRQILRYGKHEILTRIDHPFYQRKGYDKDYLGSPQYHSLRYVFRYRQQLFVGLTAEKDAGEPLFGLHNRNGYDYYSPYLYIQQMGKLKALAIGNYRLSFGQGLVVSNAFTLGKSTSLSTMNTRRSGIRRHASTDEYNYFQGIGSTVEWGRVSASAFYSHRRLDAITTDTTITSIQKTGLHRTQTEAQRKGAATMQVWGGNVEYTYKQLQIGTTGIYYCFDKPYQPNLREYAKYNITGNYFYNAGIHYRYRYRRFSFAGETALDKHGHTAMIHALTYNYKQQFYAMLLHRYYDYRYWNWHARSFSESGYVQNENGWYMAVETYPIRYWGFFLSADFFSFPWWRYGVDAPSQGYDVQARATYTPNRQLNMFVRYRYKQKEKNYTGDDNVKSIRPLHRHQIRYQLNYTYNQGL